MHTIFRFFMGMEIVSFCNGAAKSRLPWWKYWALLLQPKTLVWISGELANRMALSGISRKKTNLRGIPKLLEFFTKKFCSFSIFFFPKFSIFEWLEFGFSTNFSRKSMYHSILVELKASLDSLSLESLSSGTALCYMRNETRIIILTGQLCTVQSQ